MNNDRFQFRAWHKPTKRLFEVLCFTPSLVFENTVDGIYKIEDCELDQCTGIKDESGNLIYEGDIVNVCDSNRGVVDWDKSQYQIVRCGAKLPIRLKYVSIRNIETKMFVEVIGNIRENKNLLEEQEDEIR